MAQLPRPPWKPRGALGHLSGGAPLLRILQEQRLQQVRRRTALGGTRDAVGRAVAQEAPREPGLGRQKLELVALERALRTGHGFCRPPGRLQQPGQPSGGAGHLAERLGVEPPPLPGECLELQGAQGGRLAARHGCGQVRHVRLHARLAGEALHGHVVLQHRHVLLLLLLLLLLEVRVARLEPLLRLPGSPPGQVGKRPLRGLS